MPIYCYRDSRSGELYDIVQKMTDKHEAFAQDGFKLERIFTKPQSSIDTRIDPNSSQDFIKKTRNKNYSIGNLWDESQRLSEQRSGMTGKDEIREKVEKAYETKTGGKRHPHSQMKTNKIMI